MKPLKMSYTNWSSYEDGQKSWPRYQKKQEFNGNLFSLKLVYIYLILKTLEM